MCGKSMPRFVVRQNSSPVGFVGAPLSGQLPSCSRKRVGRRMRPAQRLRLPVSGRPTRRCDAGTSGRIASLECINCPAAFEQRLAGEPFPAAECRRSTRLFASSQPVARARA